MIIETNIVNDNFAHDSNYKRIYIKQNMDYEKKYKEALNKAKDMLSYREVRQEDMEYLFPELKKSEDEKIRKTLIHIVKGACSKYGIKYQGKEIGEEKLLSWLEKQELAKESTISKYENETCKENATRNKIAEYLKKLILDQSQRGAHMLDYEGRIEEEVDFIINIAKKELKQGEQKLTDKVEPKFEVGKWIVSNKKDIFLIKSVNNGYCTLETTEGNIYTPLLQPTEDDYHLWTIQDAKDGDVLAEDSCMFIIKKLNNDNSAEIYCCLHDDGVFDVALGLVFDETSTHPVTKEQRDLLFQNMKEAGYEWDAEKKELKKIEQNSIEPDDLIEESYQQQADDLIDMVTENSAWSE